MNTTNTSILTMDPTEFASKLAKSDDRFAFFVALILLGLAGVWLVRWLIGQNQKLADTLNSSHATYEAKLEVIVEKQNDLISASTEARVAHTEAIRENSEILRKNSETLSKAQEVLIKHGHTAAMLILMPITLLGSGCVTSTNNRYNTDGTKWDTTSTTFFLAKAQADNFETTVKESKGANYEKTVKIKKPGVESQVGELMGAMARLIDMLEKLAAKQATGGVSP